MYCQTTLLYTHLHGKWDLGHHNPPDSSCNQTHESATKLGTVYDDVIKWKQFPRYLSFV